MFPGWKPRTTGPGTVILRTGGVVPLARTYDAALGRVVTTAYDGYVDRLSRWSDIREYLPFLYETAKQYPQVRVLEFGARKGNSTLAFLAAAEAAGGYVLSVDIE